MQTLPTSVSQTKALSLADVANQNGAQVNKSSTENAKKSFQAELNRQVRFKQNQAQTKQEKGAESLKNQAQQKSSVKNKSEDDKAQFSANQDLSSNQSENSFLIDLSKQLEAARDLSGKVVLDEVKDLSQDVITANATDKEPATSNLISTLGIFSGQALQNNTNALEASSEAGSKLETTADLLASQKNLMPTLNGSSKLAPGATKQDDTSQIVDDVMAKPQNEKLVDVLASKTESKLVAEELAFNKAMANVATKELPVKDASSNIIQTQAATVSAVQTNSSLASQQLASANLINVYPGKSGWDQAISQKVVWMLGAGQQSASLTLNPPDLGPLKVVINVHNDQADTTFISDNDEVRKALESGMSHLRDKMSESGIQLGQANVSTSQQSQQEFQQAAQNRVNQNVKNQINEPAVEGGDQARVTVRVSDGLVDTFA
ncbi:MAG: flagellar hook-length control protein FliK [Methylotenera sp.]|uniref:flagellar hook-length control protein FliK n=1 Tax=Methylotenera sp. TaxID=2051956 RepID=UPI0027187923|nr:flagellar hook-length control protein FliK [Methylotenera sp.]MDO9151643.1 flagellar hook-length control protein FliK [Methylotenera sp.]